ncbi:MAG TPA: Npt1/Npt2 family nucleotide transporter [Actinomycetota bacterium]|nr:Npt1/Npt2 family nucleotide transporter [Actinomycetota bacterium]
MSVASRVFRVQKGEGSVVALVVGLMFVFMASGTIGESGIDALFFDHLGAQALPVMYLLQGGVMLIVMFGLTGILGRLGPRRAYIAAPLVLAAMVVAERGLLVAGGGWVYRLLWVTAALATLVGGIALWGTAGAVVDTRQAKRLFPIFGAGGILGSVVGGLVTPPLASAIGTENLLFVWAGGLVVAFALTRPVLGPVRATPLRHVRSRASALRGMTQGFAFVRRSRLLVWMSIAAVLFSILFYTLYFPYAGAAAAHYPDPARLAGFFGLFWAASTAAAFLVSMLVANRLFVWAGVAAMVIVLPVLYAAAFGILLVASGFVILVAIRFVTSTWLAGVSGPGWEAMVNVVPEQRRDQTRAFLNGGPGQVGTMIAGVIALVGQNTLTVGQFALVGLGASVLTIVAAVGIRRSYAAALVDALRTGRPQVFQRSSIRAAPIDLPADADSVGVLSRALRSPDVRERRLAFQLLADLPPGARPPEVADGVDDEDPLVRLAAVGALDLSSPAARDRARSLIDDPDTSVAAAAAALNLALPDGDRALSRIHELLGHGDQGVRRATIEQLVLAPPDQAAKLASEALDDPVADVRAAALEVVGATAPDRVLDRAAADLRDPSPAVRVAAGRALGSSGSRSLDRILEALQDRSTAEAAIEAVRHMELNGDADRVRSFVRSMADRAGRDRDLARAIPQKDDAARLLREAVLDRGRSTARAGLWAATMVERRRSEMEAAIENLDGPASQLAVALETLDVAGDPSLLRPLLTLWEPADPASPRGDWLSLALEDEDEFIKRCADFVHARRQGGPVSGSVATLTVIERILFLRNVSLFADLAPVDLERVAELVDEQGFADGEVIGSEGELGEELFIVVDGTIRVVQDRSGAEHELARRTTGDVVGEMSLITRSPRIASLLADGAVRTIRLGHRDFESMLRERPGIALAVMRVLAGRIAEDAKRDGVGEEAV